MWLKVVWLEMCITGEHAHLNLAELCLDLDWCETAPCKRIFSNGCNRWWNHNGLAPTEGLFPIGSDWVLLKRLNVYIEWCGEKVYSLSWLMVSTRALGARVRAKCAQFLVLVPAELTLVFWPRSTFVELVVLSTVPIAWIAVESALSCPFTSAELAVVLRHCAEWVTISETVQASIIGHSSDSRFQLYHALASILWSLLRGKFCVWVQNKIWIRVLTKELRWRVCSHWSKFTPVWNSLSSDWHWRCFTVRKTSPNEFIVEWFCSHLGTHHNQSEWLIP